MHEPRGPAASAGEFGAAAHPSRLWQEKLILPWQGARHRRSLQSSAEGTPHGGADVVTESEKSACVVGRSEVQVMGLRVLEASLCSQR